MSNPSGVEHRVSVDFDDSPTLGEIADAVETMYVQGAPAEAAILLKLGDKGSQRDPWPYLRGLTAKWSA